MKRRVSRFVLVGLVLHILASGLQGQTTGKIAGKVVDATNGEPLPAANVILEGTTRGAATDENGEFVILNVPPGDYTLAVRMIGYETVRMEHVRVSVNRTTNVQVQMNPTAIEGQVVVVQAERIEMKKDQTSSIRNVSADDIDKLPVESMGAIIALQPGVVHGHFRGGRLSEVAYLIDGLPVTEPFGGTGRIVDLEPESIKDLEVITGTFNAEYGRAMSGVVNAVTKDGTNRFDGSIYFSLANYLTPHKNIFIGLRDDEFDRNKDLRFQLSGPVLRDKLTFFTNFRWQDNKNHLNGVRRFRVDDYSNFEADDSTLWYSEHTGDSAYVPMNRSKNLSYLAKLTARPFSDVKMSLVWTANQDEWHDYNHMFKYNPDGMAATHRNSYLLAYELNHMLSARLFYELKLSYAYQYHGWYVYKDPQDPRYVHDKYFRSDPGFYTGGQQKGHDERWLRDYNAKFDLTWQVNKNHSIKTGAQFIQHDLDEQYKEIRNKYYGTDREQDFYEPITLPDSSIYSDIYRVKPREFSAYVQDKMEFDEMVINVGVRFDYFDPNHVYPSNRRNPANQLYFDDPMRMSTYPKAHAKYQVSPRLGLSYQLAQTALLHFSYGHFFQMPPLYAMYQNHAFRVAPNNYSTTMGNAEIHAQKTVQYEVGLWQQLTDAMALEVALFYRDIYDLLSTSVITTYNQIRYGLYSNKDYGNARGLEVKYDFRWRNVTAMVNYTLQYTRGNADYPTYNFNREGQNLDPIRILIPMSWDQRHTLNATVGYHTENYGATLTAYYNSGTPFTWQPISASTLARVNLLPNNSWQPSTYSVDFTGYYDVPLRGDLRLRFEMNVYNLLDRLNEVRVNPQTGRAYTAIIRETDIAGHRSDFNEYIDRVQDPSMYSAPRLVKFGVSLMF
ncbi:MAG: TonB-dependent receptor [candidate division KSB1 bacterium]|nr:TonB-dependent receptor [candidate division KSB1 bacterium]